LDRGENSAIVKLQANKFSVGWWSKNRSMWLQARFSTIDFDYLAYFYLRFDEYKKCKEEVLSLTHNYLASGRI